MPGDMNEARRMLAEIFERAPDSEKQNVAAELEKCAVSETADLAKLKSVLSQTSRMTFGRALAEMKLGKKVRRAGWNGRGMWVALTPGSVTPAANARAGACLLLARESGKVLVDASDVTINSHIDMRAADGSLVVGWLASQTDMLAEDWSVVE